MIYGKNSRNDNRKSIYFCIQNLRWREISHCQQTGHSRPVPDQNIFKKTDTHGIQEVNN